MAAEDRLLSDFEHSVAGNPILTPKALTLALSLISNSFTSDPTLTSLLETLTRLLQNPSLSSAHHQHIFSLLSAVSRRQPHIRRRIVDSACAFILHPSTPAPSIRYALSLLLSIEDCGDSSALTGITVSSEPHPSSEAGGNERSESIRAEECSSLGSELAYDPFADESLFISLSFGQGISTRHWLLRNVSRFNLRPSVLLMILLGFTKDPYPGIRAVALDGLVKLRACIVVDDQSLIEGCYFRVVELLFDADSSVRCSAVHAVSEWGKLLVACSKDGLHREWADALFVQLCSMVRDMDIKVRAAAFSALGSIRMVSEDILLQTLSKRALTTIKEKKYPGQHTAKLFKIPASAVAFAFVHGLEDEFHEVRRSACCSLRMLTVLSAEFAREAVNMLMDMLNDDSVAVRLEALETMHHVATHGHLSVEEAYLHMFLGTIADSNVSVRNAARRNLGSTKIQNLTMFKLCIDSLIKNLEVYPQDEADILSVLFQIGQNHGRFVISTIQNVSEELEPSFDGKLGFQNSRTVALLGLAISSPVSLEQEICTIPPQIFSYAVTLLERISHSLANIMNQDALLSYLSRCSRFTAVSASEFFKRERQALQLQEKENYRSLSPCSREISGDHSLKLQELDKAGIPAFSYNATMHDMGASTVRVILQKIPNIWALIQLGSLDEVGNTIRSWKDELIKLSRASIQSAGCLEFALKYLHAIKLLGMAWTQFVSLRQLPSNGMVGSEILLNKIDRILAEKWYSFIGLGREEKLHILELVLVSCVLRLSYSKTFYFEATIKKMCSVISHVKSLQKEGSVELPNFVNELQKFLSEIGDCTEEAFDKLFLLRKSLMHFSPRQLVLSGELKCLKAEVDVRGNDCQNPFPFIAGLPVGIPFEITLYNASVENRLWLSISLDVKSTQFVFLDLHEVGGCNDIRKFTFVAPFYRTPKVQHFCLRFSIAKECLSEDVQLLGDRRGPRGKLLYLSKEKEVHLSMAVK